MSTAHAQERAHVEGPRAPCVGAMILYERARSVMEPPKAKPQAIIVVQGRQVFVTPLTSCSIHQATTSVSAATSLPVNKLLLKAFSKNKKTFKTFTLRHLLPLSTVAELKQEIKEQLLGDVTEELDVGYYDTSTQISIRNTQDLTELWSDSSRGKKIVLWCDGLGEKRDLEFEEQEILHPRKKRKNKHSEESDKAEEIVHSLKETHGKSFTPMQYRIWGRDGCWRAS